MKKQESIHPQKEARTPRLREYHQARWNEPVIMELSCAGQRGILVPRVEEAIKKVVGDPKALLPEGMRRKVAPVPAGAFTTAGAQALLEAFTGKPRCRLKY